MRFRDLKAEASPDSDKPIGDKKKIRLRGAAILGAGAALLVLAYIRIELPPCSFLTKTGYPCPGCGMTTSMAAVSRGQVIRAFRAQPFGIILFLAICVLTVAGAVELVCGRAAAPRLKPGLWWLWAAIAGLLAGWAIKIGLGLASGELPLR